MVDLKLKTDWDHTAALLATILNSRMGVKQSQMVSLDKYNPYNKRQKRTGGKIRISDMARGFGVKQ